MKFFNKKSNTSDGWFDREDFFFNEILDISEFQAGSKVLKLCSVRPIALEPFYLALADGQLSSVEHLNLCKAVVVFEVFFISF